MILYILIFVFTFLLVLHYRSKQKYIKQCLQSFNGPPPKFLVGEFKDNSVENFKILKNLQDKYGPISKLFIGPRAYLLVSDQELVEVLLTSQKHLKKGADYQLLQPWLMNGLLLSKVREILAFKFGQNIYEPKLILVGPVNIFNKQIIIPTQMILEDFIPIFNAGSDVLVQKLQSEAGKEVVNIYPYITACALDVLCETAMGTTVNAQSSPNNKYVSAVKTMCSLYVKKKFSPWLKKNFIFQFTSDYKIQTEALKTIHGFTRSVIERRRKELLNEGEKSQIDDTGVRKKTAFLDLLLQSTVHGEGLSDMDILEEVETFMFAGHDTTASAISFTLYEIAHNPHVQDKIIEELKDIFSDDSSRQPTMQDFNNMKYLELVIKEAMRRYPPVPYFSRELEEDLEYKGILIPEGVTITVFTYHMHRRPELFPNPEEFNPDRFLYDSQEQKNHFAYIPFSAGPRNCIGQKFAMLELKAVLSKILRNFKVLAADSKYNVVLSGEVILKTANGVSIRLERRHF